jgi:tRNA1(Val) A37 N6-methylase TrmN6
MRDDDLVPGPGESLDRLAGDWRIFQLTRGHRFSTDDLATSWRAALAAPHARTLLDLGSGIGSVGLTTLWRLGASPLNHRAACDVRPTRPAPHGGATSAAVGADVSPTGPAMGPVVGLVGIEAQDVSIGLARRTARVNGLQDRVRFVHGDLRDASVLPEGASFELITGSPPYIPEGKGLLSPVAQRAGARIELRGSVYDYCEAARRWLAPGGRFVYVMAAADPRTEDAPRLHGFAVLERWEYQFRPGQPPLISTIVCARAEDGPHPERTTGTLVIRGPDGEWTEEYLAFRAAMGADALRRGRGTADP